jgi:hypothetical protein
MGDEGAHVESLQVDNAIPESTAFYARYYRRAIPARAGREGARSFASSIYPVWRASRGPNARAEGGSHGKVSCPGELHG